MNGTILIVSGCAGDTRRYRAWHAAEALTLAGLDVRVRTTEADPPSAADLAGVGTLILHRVAWHPDAEGWIAAVRAGGGLALYDTDDLVFDPRFGARPGALGSAPPAAYRRALTACDGATVSTTPLAAAVEALGVPAWVVPNALDLELWRLSCQAMAGRAPRGDRLVIGYASGTPTHDRDLAECAAAVQAVLADRPGAVVRLIGPLELEASWAPWLPRVERLAHLPWRDLPAALADFDINLAPLAISDAFCEAKSELKWFEAGAVGVPTIASATAVFSGAITDGRTGFSAATPSDWRAALDALVDSAERRTAVGMAARAAVLDRFVTDVRAADWLGALDGLRRRVRVGRRLDVEPATDGAERSEPAPAFTPVTDAIEAALNASPVRGPLRLDEDPTLSWGPKGAETVAAARALAASERLAALGPWLAARLALGSTAAVTPLPYPVDGAVFYPVPRVPVPLVPVPLVPTARRPGAPPLTVLCDLGSARDSTRQLALQALNIVADCVPALAVRLFASDAAAPPPAPTDLERPGWRWLGALEPQQRAALFGSDSILLAPCFGNLPLVVLEAMAAGTAVAAVDVPAVGWLLADGATACLGRPQPDALAGAVVRLLADDALRAVVAAAGRAAAERHSAGRHAAVLERARCGQPSALAPWAWQLDQLQPRGGDFGPPLTPERAVGLTVIARRPGMCRIDLRVTRADSEGVARALRVDEADGLRLSVHRGLPSAGADAVVRTATANREGRAEEWQCFSFEPIAESAGCWWTFGLSWHGAGDGPPLRALGIAGTALADAHGVRDDTVVDGWSPSFRLWAAPPLPTGVVLPDDAADALSDALNLGRAEAAEWARRERAIDATWPMRAAAWLSGGRTIPAIDRRPWSPDASAHRKALGVLWHYGPIALGREIRAQARWRAMDEADQAAARE